MSRSDRTPRSMRRWGHHAVSKGITTTAVMLLVAAAATSVGAQGSDPEFDHAKEFRQSMGFEAGDAYVRESLADPERFPSDAWGVPLTNAETNELSRRSRMVLDAGDTVAEASRMNGSAGVYMNHDRDGRLVFQFSEEVQAAFRRPPQPDHRHAGLHHRCWQREQGVARQALREDRGLLPGPSDVPEPGYAAAVCMGGLLGQRRLRFDRW